MKASINVVCYKWKVLVNGECPLMEKNRIKSNCPNKEIIQKIINDKLAEIQNRVLELNAEKKEYTTTSLIAQLLTN